MSFLKNLRNKIGGRKEIGAGNAMSTQNVDRDSESGCELEARQVPVVPEVVVRVKGGWKAIPNPDNGIRYVRKR